MKIHYCRHVSKVEKFEQKESYLQASKLFEIVDQTNPASIFGYP